MLDILIKNGQYVDFDGGRLVYGDIGVRGGKIVSVGEVGEDAKTTVDAVGKLVACGFVDIHMHEEQFAFEGEEYDIALRMLRMGVTTAVGGNCGSQLQSVADFRAAIERLGGAPCNYLLLAGYNSARRIAANLGAYERADDEQIDIAAAHVAGEIEAGASGISFGVEYDPGITEEEIVRAINAQKHRGIFAAMHYRGDGEEAIDSIREMIRIARATGTRFQISHLSSCSAMGQMEEALKLINKAVEENPQLDYDTYPYNAFCTFIGTASFDGDSFEHWQAQNAGIMIASGEHAGKFCDKALFERVREENPFTLVVVFAMRENEIAMAVANPDCGMIGSDGVLMQGLGHPRATGTFARVLAKYVRDEGALSLVCALRKMSVTPAARLGLANKTRIAPGYDADLVVFDPYAVQDRATFEEPNLPPCGYKAVVVNGRLAVMDDAVVDARAGRFIQSL
ncbi:MAG TPA: amidohydrolase family protein [Clostridia bacterium]|nr:amidohydrolase family protein [Clostridia bacterium]